MTRAWQIFYGSLISQYALDVSYRRESIVKQETIKILPSPTPYLSQLHLVAYVLQTLHGGRRRGEGALG